MTKAEFEAQKGALIDMAYSLIRMINSEERNTVHAAERLAHIEQQLSALVNGKHETVRFTFSITEADLKKATPEKAKKAVDLINQELPDIQHVYYGTWSDIFFSNTNESHTRQRYYKNKVIDRLNQIVGQL